MQRFDTSHGLNDYQEAAGARRASSSKMSAYTRDCNVDISKRLTQQRLSRQDLHHLQTANSSRLSLLITVHDHGPLVFS